jgi:tripartite-type tricarboxylate transporter receptor subunit TctC
MGRLVFRQTLLVAVALVTATPASADCSALAGQTIRWLVPSKPGGGYDRYSRLIQPFLEQRLSAQIVIENQPAAGGVVAAIAIRDAEPDGKTLGIINASGLLAASMSSASPAPDPLQDFTILARVVSNRMFLFTGRDSGIAGIQDLLQVSAARPIVVGVRDAGSASFFALPVTASMLGLNYTVVTGYVGSTSRVLAAMRGEVDVIIQNFDSVRSYVDAGELVPLLQISSPEAAGQASQLPNPVPNLGGPDGLAQQVIAETGSSAGDVELEVAALSGVISAGRLVAAPNGLPQSMESCLQTTMLAVLQSAELQSAANRVGLTIQAASAARARDGLQASKRHMAVFMPLVRSAIEQARQ